MRSLSQKSRLVSEVERLCAELKRPVSSRDLAKCWTKEPDRRPLLLQRPGQILIKAARSCENSTVIRKVGVIGNLAFYAPNSDPFWDEAFRLHGIRLRMKQHCKWGVPQQAIYLFGTEHDRYAENALAGFVAEWEPLVADSCVLKISIETGFVKMLDLAQKQTPMAFTGVCPKLHGSMRAEKLVRAACAAYRGDDAKHLNVNRHLARLSWPKTSVFQNSGFWLEQVSAYCRAQWPAGDHDPTEQRALFICMFYGLPANR